MRVFGLVLLVSVLLVPGSITFRPTVGGLPGVVVAGPSPSAGTGLGWPEFHSNPQLNGTAPDSALSTTTAATLGVAWDTNLYGAALDSPVVAYDPMIGQTLVYIGTENGNVLALNASDGAMVWGDWFGAPMRSSPLVFNGSLYIATDTTPAIYRLNATTGSEMCRMVSPMPVEGTPVVASPPGGVPTLYVGTNDYGSASGPLLAMNVANCTLEWAFTGYARTTGSWDAVSYSLDANGEPLVLFGTSDPDASVYALDAVTGLEVWRFQTYNPAPSMFDVGAGATISPPGVNGWRDGAVFVPNKYGIMYALDLTNGSEIWATDFNQIARTTEGGRSTAALNGNNLVFGYAGGVFDLSPLTGGVLWQYSDSSHTEVLSSPALAGSPNQAVVVAADLGGSLDVLSLASGTLLYHYVTGGYIASSPAIWNGNIFIASSDGFLYDFSPGGGNDRQLPSTTIASPSAGAVLGNPNGQLTVSGSATDPIGVSAVEVAIQTDGPGGPWWDPSTGNWSEGPAMGAATVLQPNSTLTNWSFAFRVPSSGGAYQVFANAVSLSGQADIKGPNVGFTIHSSTKGPHVQAYPGYVGPGAKVTIVGGGFEALENVSFVLDGRLLGSVRASSTGSVPATKWKIPIQTPFGLTAILARGETSNRSAAAGLRVANEWVDPGYSPEGTSYEPNDLTLWDHAYLGGPDWLYQAWHYAAGAPLNTSPVVADGIVYGVDTVGQVFALEGANGGLLWTTALPSPAPVSGSLAIDPARGLLFVTQSDGTFTAMSTSQGSVAWSIDLGAALSDPVVGDGKLFVTTAAASVDELVESSGAVAWTAVLSSNARAAPTFDPGKKILVVDLGDGTVTALSALNGSALWTFSAPGPLDFSATIARSSVYVGTSNGWVDALSEDRGTLLWTYDVGSTLTSAGTFAFQGGKGGRPEYAVGAASGLLYVFEASTGALDFTFKGHSAVVGVGSTDGAIVLAGTDGSITASRSYTSLLLWTYSTGAPMVTVPVIVDGTVYIAAGNGDLYAFTTFGQPPV